ncbi:hypothetical protein N657DRAFT_630536 [Parathielavia appendiculata]|uniref:Uncharacterized protein n=1 Tax=Parathielavia appendiculata TaxID=2587402 RepID=A0AAN6UB32_9PEZI|nr:hypothetical protein N657DRAFT_630536 [Parathielavia appendiculata]
MSALANVILLPTPLNTSFFVDPLRREGRFQWNSMQGEAVSLVKHLPSLDASLDTSTKPPTTDLRKHSQADPKQHTAWAKRKEEVRADFRAFDQTFLVPEGTFELDPVENGPFELGHDSKEILDKVAQAQLALTRHLPPADEPRQVEHMPVATPATSLVQAPSEMIASPGATPRASTPDSTLSAAVGEGWGGSVKSVGGPCPSVPWVPKREALIDPAAGSSSGIVETGSISGRVVTRRHVVVKRLAPVQQPD